ncbi:MAG: glutaredoxin family protein [Solirubrobacterales bacterium]
MVLYGRDGCHLCDEARAEIEAIRADRGFEVREVDIERDEALHARYLERIPVVELDGEVVSELAFEPARLLVRLDTVPR